MSFQFYTNLLGRASRNAAAGMFIAGMVLVGFGFLIFALPKLFATLAALVFFIAGIGCAVTAVRVFVAIGRVENIINEEEDQGRRNVRVRTEQIDEPY